jgi:hypothetical protein
MDIVGCAVTGDWNVVVFPSTTRKEAPEASETTVVEAGNV